MNEDGKPGTTDIIEEPKPGQPVPETGAADWKGVSHGNAAVQRTLGLRTESPHGRTHSKAGSIRSAKSGEVEDDESAGVKPHGPSGEEHIPLPEEPLSHQQKPEKTADEPVDGVTRGIQHVHTEDLPGGVPQGELESPKGHLIGQVIKEDEDPTPFNA